jgi:hypothetical protein
MKRRPSLWEKLVCRIRGHRWEDVEPGGSDDERGMDIDSVAMGTGAKVCRRCGEVEQRDEEEPRFEDVP